MLPAISASLKDVFVLVAGRFAFSWTRMVGRGTESCANLRLQALDRTVLEDFGVAGGQRAAPAGTHVSIEDPNPQYLDIPAPSSRHGLVMI
jgi:hypothetical protein